MNFLTSQLQTVTVGDWVLKVREPNGPGPYRVLLLLHGWTGDEDVMWVFAPRLPKDLLLISLRGLYATPEGGYGWYTHQEGVWPSLEDFAPAVEALERLIIQLQAGWPGLLAADYTRPSLMGFSQGAALAYSYALIHPERVDRLAGLAGFMPEGVEVMIQKQPLRGKTVFVGHGSLDERVPVALARKAVDLLQVAGAQVTYCEDEIGHKLSAGCFRGLESYFSR